MDGERLARVTAVFGAARDGTALARLVGVAVDMLSVTGGGVSVVGAGQHRGALAFSEPKYEEIDDLQFSLGEGPCLDADRWGRPALEADLSAATGRWPAFAPAALELGMHAVFAFPLRVGAQELGVLSLYRDRAGELGRVDFRDAVTLGRIATHALLELEADLPRGGLPGRLSEVIDHRAQVHQATGMIAAQVEADLATALTRLRAYAWSRDRSIDDVAADVVAGLLRFDAVDGDGA